MIRHVVVMGVSGCGKSTVAALLAERLGCEFGEADLMHPAANIAKMSRGEPLDDADRWPWLADVAGWMTARAAQGRCAVVSCSALRRSYRDVLRGAEGEVVFVHLAGPIEVIHARMALRTGHFMPTTLLQSQFDTLEPLATDEAGCTLDLTAPADRLAAEAVAWLEAG